MIQSLTNSSSNGSGTRLPVSLATDECGLVSPANFIRATRDAGYRNLANAVAELIDNSLQANATTIQIFVFEERHAITEDRVISVGVLDNGCGMDATTLQTALQFGGSERFGDRSGLGRFGMGLPNSSLSQAPRVDVYSWRSANRCLWVYLDLEEFVQGQRRVIPTPADVKLPTWASQADSQSGTLVLWSGCDRIKERKASTVARKLSKALGRLYRYALWDGKDMTVNGEPVEPIDPLMCNVPRLDGGAVAFGEPLIFEISSSHSGAASQVEVRFTELPVSRWYDLANETKRNIGVVGGAGVSILRSGREIDYGWYFMGEKRKENYDDWWRCEVRFNPDLDELFGVTNNKQGIIPTRELRMILEADLEPIARFLNGRVRRAFEGAKKVRLSRAEAAAARQDCYLPQTTGEQPNRVSTTAGYRYKIEVQPIATPAFFEIVSDGNQIRVVLNEYHPFYRRAYLEACRSNSGGEQFRLETLVLAAARASLTVRSPEEQEWERRQRALWSDALAAFLNA
jgi:hypothetical protein